MFAHQAVPLILLPPNNPLPAIAVEDLEHLEAVLEKSGTCMAIMFFYSRTCGVCKDALKQYESMCKDAAGSKARVVFMQADVINEYDQLSGV
jgi:hypothetical protein